MRNYEYNPINNTQTNFNGYLKFKTGRYVNTKNITTVLYDYPDLVANDKFHSSAFLMSDGLKYIIKYLSKPKATLIENIINADKDHKTIVEIDAQIVAMDHKAQLFEEMQNQNMNPYIPQK